MISIGLVSDTHYQDRLFIGVLGKITYEDVRAVVRAVVPLYKRSLSDGRMRREDLLKTISSSDLITANDKQSILEAIIRCR